MTSTVAEKRERYRDKPSGRFGQQPHPPADPVTDIGLPFADTDQLLWHIRGLSAQADLLRQHLAEANRTGDPGRDELVAQLGWVSQQIAETQTYTAQRLASAGGDDNLVFGPRPDQFWCQTDAEASLQGEIYELAAHDWDTYTRALENLHDGEDLMLRRGDGLWVLKRYPDDRGDDPDRVSDQQAARWRAARIAAASREGFA